MWSQSTNVTDIRTDRQRQTTCDRKTALCTKVHRAVKTKQLYFSLHKVKIHHWWARPRPMCVFSVWCNRLQVVKIIACVITLKKVTRHNADDDVCDLPRYSLKRAKKPKPAAALWFVASSDRSVFLLRRKVLRLFVLLSLIAGFRTKGVFDAVTEIYVEQKHRRIYTESLSLSLSLCRA